MKTLTTLTLFLAMTGIGLAATQPAAVEHPGMAAFKAKDYATALACFDSEEYQQVKELRTKASQSELVIVEGYDGPQPG